MSHDSGKINITPIHSESNSTKDSEKEVKKVKKMNSRPGKRTHSKSKLSSLLSKKKSGEESQGNSSTGEGDMSVMMALDISLVIGENVKKINILCSENANFHELVRRAIKEYNKQFTEEKVDFRLKEEPEKFAFKPSKKNGFPKTDYPSFDSESLLKDAENKYFTLVWKETPKDFKCYFEKV